jgi:hypothetical protein
MTPTFVEYAAKAVAAFVTPLVVALLAWLAAKGFDLGYDVTLIEPLIVSIATSIVVYFKRNKPVAP